MAVVDTGRGLLQRLGSLRGRSRHAPVDQVPVATGARWSSERLFFSGDDFFDELIAEIAKARYSVTIETYIFADDAVGRRMEEALAEAAARGLVVRLMVDGWGAGPWAVSRAHQLAARDVEVRVYHPLPFLFTPKGAALSRKSRALGYLRAINRRDHRKVSIIDRRIAFVGSINVDGCHTCTVAAENCWRDTVARVEGGAVWELEKATEHAWRRSLRIGRPRLRTPLARRPRRSREQPAGLVRLNNRMRLREFWYRELVRRIRWAERRVLVTNTYFVPNGQLLRALAAAARAGRDVRVLVPSKSDVAFMPWVAAAFYLALLKTGVRVFEYQPCILHAKTMVIDDWISVGSSNLNTRSLKHDLEVDVVLTSPASLAAMVAQFEKDLEKSVEITASVLQARPWWQRTIARIALRLRYWM